MENAVLCNAFEKFWNGGASKLETSATQNYQLNIISYFDPVMAIQPSRLNWVNPLDHETRPGSPPRAADRVTVLCFVWWLHCLQAISYMQQDLVVAKKLGDTAGECRAHGNLGSAYFSKGNYKASAV